MKSNLLTLAIPTRNYINGVQNIIDEIKKKKLQKIQIIFFENSTDQKILDLLNKEKKNLDFEVIISNNLNFIDHWNKILKTCKTKYLLMLHHDEIIPIRTLENLIYNIENNEKDFYILKIKKISHKKKWKIGFPTFLIYFFINHLKELILYINFIGPLSAFCFKHDHKYYFKSEIKYYVDMHLYYQVFENSKNFSILKKSIFSDTSNQHSITKDFSKLKNQMKNSERLFFKNYYKISNAKDLFFYITAEFLRVINALIERINKHILSY